MAAILALPQCDKRVPSIHYNTITYTEEEKEVGPHKDTSSINPISEQCAV